MKCNVAPVFDMKEDGGVEVPLNRNLCSRCRALVNLTPGHLLSWKEPPVIMKYVIGCAPKPVWTFSIKDNFFFAVARN